MRPNDYHENHSGGSTSVVDPLQEQGIRHNFTQFVPPYTICALYTICAVICTGGGTCCVLCDYIKAFQ